MENELEEPVYTYFQRLTWIIHNLLIAGLWFEWRGKKVDQVLRIQKPPAVCRRLNSEK